MSELKSNSQIIDELRAVNSALVKALEKIISEGSRTGYSKLTLVRTAKQALNSVVSQNADSKEKAE